MTFRVGDRVRVIAEYSHHLGSEGVVVRSPDSGAPPALPGHIEIRLDGYLAAALFRVEEVEAVT